MLTLHIAGITPQAQARPRVYRVRGRVITHSPKTNFYRAIYIHALAQRPKLPLDGPLSLTAEFIFPRPSSIPAAQIYKWTRPDTDNLIKAVMDALSAARWWVDDARVACLTTIKIYADVPGVDIVIKRLTI